MAITIAISMAIMAIIIGHYGQYYCHLWPIMIALVIAIMAIIAIMALIIAIMALIIPWLLLLIAIIIAIYDHYYSH